MIFSESEDLKNLNVILEEVVLKSLDTPHPCLTTGMANSTSGPNLDTIFVSDFST